MMPVRAALVIPAEGIRYGETAAGDDAARSWFDEVARSLGDELRHAFALHYCCHQSPVQHREIATSGDGRVVALDAEDQGCTGTRSGG
ncbi:MAG: hypothetical protein ACREMU_12845, partial [Gemmatimonadaceae bacterium]